MKIGKAIAQRFVKGYKVLKREEIAEDRKYLELGLLHRQEGPRPPREEEISIKLEVEESKEEGFEIPETSLKIGKMAPLQRVVPGKTLIYPLIPNKPKKGEIIYAYTKVFWDKKLNRYIYKLIEPELSERLKKMFNKIREILEERLDVDFSKLKSFEAGDYLRKEVDEILKYFKFVVTEDDKKILKYYIERDFIGLGKIEPLMRDSNIEDVSCDGIGIPLFLFHRSPDIGSVITNVVFDTKEDLDSFIIRLSQLCGKSISIAEPLIDGTLPDGSRIQLTLATDIARRGSNFSIRKFTEEPLTPIHILNFGTVDIKTLAYLWFIVDSGGSVLVSGGTASGKTSFLNILSLFIRPEKKIISIEDTGELRLPHSHWIPSVARTAESEEFKTGQVDLFDLLKVSLRQRPDYTIVGEVRGKEAYILFQQMATGHPSMATIHAENLPKLMDRLTTPPVSLSPSLISSLDVAIFLGRMHYKNKFTRKVTEIIEIVGFNRTNGSPITRNVCKWNPAEDKFDFVGNSILLKRISEETGIKEREVKEEIERRIAVLNWLQKHNICDYVNIYKVFSLYYREPQKLLSVIEGEL